MFKGFYESEINLLEQLQIPNTYWNKQTLEYKYWFRSLLQKVDSALVFKGLPKGWNEDYFHLVLWVKGYLCVFPTSRKDLLKFGEDGITFASCQVAGMDFFYQPTIATIANPYYSRTLKIGKQCEILKLTPDFKGILDIIDYYACKLAEISKGIDMGIKNAKVPMILSAKNMAQSATLQKVYDKVQAGESLVVMKDFEDEGEVMPVKDPFESWTQDFKQTYIVHQLLEDMQKILDSFYCEIGLPVAIEKKERLVTSEADFASAQSQARISCWVETLKECLKVINEKYELNIEVEYAHETDTDRNGEGTEQETEVDN